MISIIITILFVLGCITFAIAIAAVVHFKILGKDEDTFTGPTIMAVLFGMTLAVLLGIATLYFQQEKQFRECIEHYSVSKK